MPKSIKILFVAAIIGWLVSVYSCVQSWKKISSEVDRKGLKSIVGDVWNGKQSEATP